MLYMLFTFYIVLPWNFWKWKSFAVDASNHILLECFFFFLNSVEGMNTRYIYFEKSIAVKTPVRFCSELRTEVIFE